MSTGLVDNGMLMYVGERYVAYFGYSVWNLAKRLRLSDGRRVWDVLTRIFYEGGSAGEYIAELVEARDVVNRDCGFIAKHENRYQNPLKHHGRFGKATSLYEAFCALADACQSQPESVIWAEQQLGYDMSEFPRTKKWVRMAREGYGK